LKKFKLKLWHTRCYITFIDAVGMTSGKPVGDKGLFAGFVLDIGCNMIAAEILNGSIW
jgi:hypothetical protein